MPRSPSPGCDKVYHEELRGREDVGGLPPPAHIVRDEVVDDAVEGVVEAGAGGAVVVTGPNGRPVGWAGDSLGVGGEGSVEDGGVELLQCLKSHAVRKLPQGTVLLYPTNPEPDGLVEGVVVAGEDKGEGGKELQYEKSVLVVGDSEESLPNGPQHLPSPILQLEGL